MHSCGFVWVTITDCCFDEVLLICVSSRCAGQHRPAVSAPLQEDRGEGEEEGHAGEQKEPRDGKRRSTANM